MILPLPSIKNVRVQVFQEANSVNLNWRYQLPNYQRKETIKEKRREEPGYQIIQLRLYYDGRIVFSYSDRPSLVTSRPQLESVQVGLSLTNLDQLDLTESLEQLDRESGVMMIPRAQFYQMSQQEMEPGQVVPAGQHTVTNIKQINITVELPFVMTLFEEQFSFVTIKTGGLLCFVGESLQEETGNCLSVGDVTPSQISYGATHLSGTRCFSVTWWLASPSPQAGHQGRLDCLLCQDGRVVFQFVKLTHQYYSGVNLVDSFLPSGLKRNMKTDHSQIIFSPLSSCSLSASCLTSPDCPLLSKLQNCRRFRCLSPSSPSNHCSPSVTLAAAGGEEIAGVVSGLLGLAALLAVITFTTRRLHRHLSCLSSSHQGSHQQLHTTQDTEDTAL